MSLTDLKKQSINLNVEELKKYWDISPNGGIIKINEQTTGSKKDYISTISAIANLLEDEKYKDITIKAIIDKFDVFYNPDVERIHTKVSKFIESQLKENFISNHFGGDATKNKAIIDSSITNTPLCSLK